MVSNTPSRYIDAPAAPPRARSGRLVSLALATAFVLVWTSGYLVGDIGTSASPPLTLLFWRFLLATAVIGTIALAVAAVGLDGERLRPAGWVGLGLGLAGVGVAVSTELSGGARIAGILLSALGLAGFAAGTLLQKHAPASADLRTGTTIQIGAAMITSVPLALVSGSGLALPLTATAIGSVVWLAVVNSVGGLLLLFVLLRRRSGAGATSYLFLVPPVTALLAVPVLGQPRHRSERSLSRPERTRPERRPPEQRRPEHTEGHPLDRRRCPSLNRRRAPVPRARPGPRRG